MALPDIIYINPPYIAVSISLSNYGYSTTGPASFGIIEQINYDTLGYNVGDNVLYLIEGSLGFGNAIAGQYKYFIIDERKILFKEGVPIPLP